MEGRKIALLVDSDWIYSAAHRYAQLLRDQEAHLKFSIFLNLEIHVYVPVVIVRRWDNPSTLFTFFFSSLSNQHIHVRRSVSCPQHCRGRFPRRGRVEADGRCGAGWGPWPARPAGPPLTFRSRCSRRSARTYLTSEIANFYIYIFLALWREQFYPRSNEVINNRRILWHLLKILQRKSLQFFFQMATWNASYIQLNIWKYRVSVKTLGLLSELRRAGWGWVGSQKW